MNSVNTTVGFLGMANTVTGGYFWSMIDFLVFTVLFVTLAMTFGAEAALLSAGFIAIVLSVLLIYATLIPMWIGGMFIGALIIGIIYIIWRNPYD